MSKALSKTKYFFNLFHDKQKILKTGLLVFLYMAFGIASALFIFAEDSEKGQTFFGPKKDNSVVTYWQNQIETIGAENAYQELKKSIDSDISDGRKHIFAHYFGEALYKTLGIDGVSVCDDDLTFGCYHSFFGFAISDKGLDVLTEMDEKCIAAYGSSTDSCQHGLGHGVITELGHDNLEAALLSCSKLSTKTSVEGCTGGVFMEYNFNTMKETNIRQPKDGDYHFPCNDIPEQFVESCYTELPFWWVLHSNKDFGFVGKKCGEVSNQSLRTACYEGVGRFTVAVLGYSDFEVDSVCKYMGDKDAVISCKNSAFDTLSKRQVITQ